MQQALSEQPEFGAVLPLQQAERYCADLARREAKNFYWGFIALPRPKRMAIYALYGFARQVDDEADKPRGERNAVRLAWHRERLSRCLAGSYSDPVMQLLAAAVDRFQIPAEELEQVITGVEVDLERNRYQSWEELRTYCRLVASSVGRMCVRIFGYRDRQALAFADDLGVAMQITNILRDLREDLFQFGRIYLPLAELEQFGIGEEALVQRLAGAADGIDRGWAEFVHFQAERARGLFETGLQVADLIPASSAACVLTMAGIYQGILKQIEADPTLPLTQRVSLSASAKLEVLVRSWLRAV